MAESKIYTTFKEIYFYLDDGDRRFLSQYHLTVPRFYTLKHIGEQPGISPTQLSALMLTDKSNITRLIKGMEAEGLIARYPHATDGRTICLQLTDPGAELLKVVAARHALYNQQRFSFLSADQSAFLEELVGVKGVLENQFGGHES